MSSIDYALLGGDAAGDPPDGWRGSAILVRAALVGNPTKLVTEWQSASEPAYYWSTWFNFDGRGLEFTQEFLDSIGVDRRKIVQGNSQEERDDNLEGELYKATAKTWAVAVSVTTRGDRSFVNLTVNGTPDAQGTLDTDAPADARGLPTASVGSAAGATTSTDPADEDIPF